MLLHSKIIGEGKPFLILHGLFGSSDNWYSFGKCISKKFEIHLIDLRNHGKSFHQDKMDNDIMSEDILNYIKHFNLKDVILMGHSLGGKVAMNFAVNFPDYLEKLIVVDICPKFYVLKHTGMINMLDNLDLSILKSRKEAYVMLYQISNEDMLSRFLVKNLYRTNNNLFAFRFNLDSIKTNINSFGKELNPNDMSLTEAIFIKGEKSDYIL